MPIEILGKNPTYSWRFAVLGSPELPHPAIVFTPNFIALQIIGTPQREDPFVRRLRAEGWTTPEDDFPRVDHPDWHAHLHIDMEGALHAHLTHKGVAAFHFTTVTPERFLNYARIRSSLLCYRVPHGELTLESINNALENNLGLEVRMAHTLQETPARGTFGQSAPPNS